MMKIFNTEFELSLRLLLALNVIKTPVFEEELVYFDLLSTYGASFGLSDFNLNGDKSNPKQDINARKRIIRKALKNLVFKGEAIAIQEKEKGYQYKISAAGKKRIETLSDFYSAEYTKVGKSVKKLMADKGNKALLRYINGFKEETNNG